MKKLLNLVAVHPSAETEHFDNMAEAAIKCKAEHWNIICKTTDAVGAGLENAVIKVLLHDGRQWQGTIQDFGTLHSVMNNALGCLQGEFGHMKEGDHPAVEYINDMQVVLSHFTDNPRPTHSQIPEQKEISMVAAIMGHEVMEELSQQVGLLVGYEYAANLAPQFYKEFRSFDYEEMQFPDGSNPFPDATGWEDMIILWTRKQIRDGNLHPLKG